MVVGMASKCPQMSTIKVFMHKRFEFSGFFTWSSMAVWHGLPRWLDREVWKKK